MDDESPSVDLLDERHDPPAESDGTPAESHAPALPASPPVAQDVCPADGQHLEPPGGPGEGGMVKKKGANSWEQSWKTLCKINITLHVKIYVHDTF